MPLQVANNPVVVETEHLKAACKEQQNGFRCKDSVPFWSHFNTFRKMEKLLHWRTLILHRTIERKIHNWVSTSGNAPLKFNTKIITFVSSFFSSFLIIHLYFL